MRIVEIRGPGRSIPATNGRGANFEQRLVKVGVVDERATNLRRKKIRSNQTGLVGKISKNIINNKFA
ncbi:hypothetical protein LNQ52_16505 [Klebsiella pneumoniae subsp. pneumoniae]|nr:hypothetical protein [Klebsiella pneumoniae subsp. pneumoniae]